MVSNVTVSFDTVLEYADSVLTRDESRILRDDDRAHHAPEWHVFGVLGHTWSVIESAKILAEECGLDITELAAIHDLGKINRFPRALRLVRRGEDPASAYRGHEHDSAVEAAHLGFDELDCAVVEIHNAAYNGTRASVILRKLRHDPIAVQKWLLLCAADAAGKGWTEAQTRQRPLIAQRFKSVAEQVGLTEHHPVVFQAIRAASSWNPVTPPSFL